MIPTNLSFEGPPVTPTDTHWHRIDLPIPPLLASNPIHQPLRTIRSISDQLRSTLKQWQRPLFGPVLKLQPATNYATSAETNTPS